MVESSHLRGSNRRARDFWAWKRQINCIRASSIVRIWEYQSEKSLQVQVSRGGIPELVKARGEEFGEDRSEAEMSARALCCDIYISGSEEVRSGEKVRTPD